MTSGLALRRSGLQWIAEETLMSHSHIRVAKPVPQRNLPLEVSVGVVAFLVILLFAVSRFGDGFFPTDYVTADGAVSETRIVVDHMLDSNYGGRIFYRIEAHVNFELGGQPQDRWVTVSEVTTGRLELASKVAAQPKSCQVYWAPGHPENAKCRLK